MVEEDKFRTTYRSVNERRCVFEKAILSRRCSCICATRFYLADREGVACDSAPAHRRCSRLIYLLRENARFALKLTAIDGELPHAKEIKVQNGGLLGLQHVLRPDLNSEHVIDVTGLATLGERTFGSLEKFPYREIVKAIVAFEGRPRPRSRR
jgi:hypothetical protein